MVVEASAVFTNVIMLVQWFWVRGIIMVRPIAVQPLATLVEKTFGQAAALALQG